MFVKFNLSMTRESQNETFIYQIARDTALFYLICTASIS